MLTRTPPDAPTAPARPMSAPDSRRASRCAAASSMPSAIFACAFAWKTEGIILYAEPLPTPLKTNNAMKPPTNSGRECAQGRRQHEGRRPGHCHEVPEGDDSAAETVGQRPADGADQRAEQGAQEGQRRGRDRVANSDLNWIWSTWPNAKLNPMNEPNVPM